MNQQKHPVYLDYNATTPIAPPVQTAMLPYVTTHFGNPSSDHPVGRHSADAVQTARRQLSELLGCHADEVVFTGGGSESDNQALLGRLWASKKTAAHFVTSVTEHPAILTTCRFLESLGHEVTYLPVDGDGRVDPDSVRRAIRPNTVVVSIMHANNETGTIQPIPEIGRLCQEMNVVFHTDAAQSVGKIPTDIDQLHVDLLTVAGHKLYAPKGIGALYVRRGTALESFIHGAGHESGLRAGTENVASIVALGAAAQLARETQPVEAARQQQLRDEFHQLLKDGLENVRLNGHPVERLPNTLNLRFVGRDGNDILARTPEIAASTGSACHAGQTEPSAVLLAMGIPADEAVGAVRLTLGRETTSDEIRQAAQALIQTVSNSELPIGPASTI